MVGRRISTKSRHTLLHDPSGIVIQHIVVLIIEGTVDIGKCPINKLLLHPVIAFSILPLKAHIDCHGLVCHGHGQRHHNAVILNIPHGLYATLDNIQLIKGKEQIQIVLRGHGFLFDEMILRQIHCFIVHKAWRGRKRSHQTKQAVLYGKLLNCLLNFSIRLLAHAHTPDVNSIQDDPLILAQRVVNARLRRFRRCKEQSAVLRRFPFIFTISYPVGTGTFKKVFHK